jgi:hypothetical protein
MKTETTLNANNLLTIVCLCHQRRVKEMHRGYQKAPKYGQQGNRDAPNL